MWSCWDEVKSARLGRYVIYRSVDGGKFDPVGIQLPGTQRYGISSEKPG